jgi:hypothetical protein
LQSRQESLNKANLATIAQQKQLDAIAGVLIPGLADK